MGQKFDGLDRTLVQMKESFDAFYRTLISVLGGLLGTAIVAVVTLIATR